jgi:hypothetical protein
VAKTNGHLGSLKTSAGMLLVGCFIAAALFIAPVFAQEPSQTAPDQAAQSAGQTAPQPLDLQEAVARDVLEPLQAGIRTQNLKQVLSVFDAQSFPEFAQFRDQLRAFLDHYYVLQFRYKIQQGTATEEGSRASVTCEADIDATPLDPGQVPLRRSTQIRFQLKQTPNGWRISGLMPSDFFAL